MNWTGAVRTILVCAILIVLHYTLRPLLAWRASVDFLIVAFVVWRIAKMFIKPAPVAEKPATKNCPFCKMAVDAAATRCAYCTSAL